MIDDACSSCTVMHPEATPADAIACGGRRRVIVDMATAGVRLSLASTVQASTSAPRWLPVPLAETMQPKATHRTDGQVCRSRGASWRSGSKGWVPKR